MSVHTCPRCPLRFVTKAELVDHMDHDHHVPADALRDLSYPGASEAEPLYRKTAADDDVQSVLLIANQTLEPDHVLSLLEDIRAGDQEMTVFVLVPATPMRLMGGPAAGGAVPPSTGLDEKADDSGVATARWRLRRTLDALKDAGITAHGSVGDPNPISAAVEVMKNHPIDEIVVSTLPSGQSRWLHADLPTALQRRFGLKVSVVEADRLD